MEVTWGRLPNRPRDDTFNLHKAMGDQDADLNVEAHAYHQGTPRPCIFKIRWTCVGKENRSKKPRKCPSCLATQCPDPTGGAVGMDYDQQYRERDLSESDMQNFLEWASWSDSFSAAA